MLLRKKETNTLKVLDKVEKSLKTGNFDFGYWCSCTCGHIYAAVHGKRALVPGTNSKQSKRSRAVVLPKAGSDYERVMIEIAEAIGSPEVLEMYRSPHYGGVEGLDGRLAVNIVSGHTISVQGVGTDPRYKAIALIQKARRQLNGENDLIATAEQIVKNEAASQDRQLEHV